jgi:AraC-like DNA-binding protein
VWGYYTAPAIEKVNLYFLKRVLKVRKSTVNNMVYCELGRLPLNVERHCRMVKYWTKLLNTENCILKGCYDDIFEYSCSKPNDKQNYCCKIKEILFKYGFNYVWLNQ